MEKVTKLIDKVLSYKTWSDKRKIDTLLEHDCSMYTELGTDSTKKKCWKQKRNLELYTELLVKSIKNKEKVICGKWINRC